MRSDKIKICKKFVSIDKDFGRIKQLSSRVNKKNCLLINRIPSDNKFAKTQQKGTIWYEHEMGPVNEDTPIDLTTAVRWYGTQIRESINLRVTTSTYVPTALNVPDMFTDY